LYIEEIDRGELQVVLERRAVVVVLATPVKVAHAQAAVDEHDDASGRAGKGIGERGAIEIEGAPI